MKIEFSNQKPKYIEIFDKIAKDINDGILKGGDKLPSKRVLAMDLNVSVNTIMNAYDLLLEEGYISSSLKKGYYVEKQLLVNKKVEIKKENLIKKDKPLYDFTTQSIEGFTNTSFRKILRAKISDDEFINKTEGFGDIELRRVIAAHLKENRGIIADASHIVIGNGLEMLERILNAANIKSLTLENPGYHKLALIAKNLGFEVNYQELDDFGVSIPKYKTILYTTPFNQFPTGVKMSITRKKELLSYAEEYNTYIIEDDFDAEFRINSSPTTSLYTINPSYVIFFSTFTENIYPGLRIAYIILPDSLYDTYLSLYKGYSQSVSTLEQLALKDFILEGYYESHINKTKRRYIEKRNLIISLFKNDNRFLLEEKKNYLSILVHIKTNKKDKEIKDILKEKGIHIQLLSDFDINHKDSKTLILGYTAISKENIIKGIQIIKDAI
ncbi:GntR family transcriptional regulator/MocR family aminotransferase [Anaeroplasma bactoclasticum]|uniref:GntR family transcriptional regulator/MocR family aminotransferase n=1 Tax=Anaeroplasma bactoclasticum TaxID=2088 RepID=A0A397RVA9_9MOLU|nr:PLP-dependent aminotransferase family protein [Anaeroplasma bactoclasticum]RIA78280.1 GntR family transcriptional regulator/MocR family aminotransferase [Anaeroplasma bactoclasticum]